MRLSNNIDLPELPVWQARSFWAQLLLVASVLANAAGIDIFGALRDMGIGSNPDEVMATVTRIGSALQVLSPILFGVWAWLERRAPNFRLVFWRGAESPDIRMLLLWALLTIGLFTVAGARAALAQQPQPCMGAADLLAGLSERYGEQVLWSGLTAAGQMVTITVNPDGSSWTALSIRPGGVACILVAGPAWTAPPAPAPPGEAG